MYWGKNYIRLQENDPLQDKTILIGIGAQKAGTTWLWEYLTDHPGIFMSPIKEIHYFDMKYVPEIRPIQEQYFIKRMQHFAQKTTDFKQIRQNEFHYRQLKNYLEIFEMKDNEDYLNFFRQRVGKEPVCCEISPGYALLKAEQFSEIYNLHNRVKLMFLMRNPIDRFWSNLRFYEQMFRNFSAQDRFLDALKDSSIVGRTNYIRTIKEIRKSVPQQDLLLLFYENLFSNSALEQVCNFAGIDFHPTDLNRRVLKSKSIPVSEDHMQKAYDLFEPVYANIYKAFDGALPAVWLETMEKYGKKP